MLLSEQPQHTRRLWTVVGNWKWNESGAYQGLNLKMQALHKFWLPVEGRGDISGLTPSRPGGRDPSVPLWKSQLTHRTSASSLILIQSLRRHLVTSPLRGCWETKQGITMEKQVEHRKRIVKERTRYVLSTDGAQPNLEKTNYKLTATIQLRAKSWFMQLILINIHICLKCLWTDLLQITWSSDSYSSNNLLI